jgi:three-Cys-motif partner protein
MADNLPVVWPAEPHTCAKHAILERYLKAWFPILSQQSRHVHRRTEQILFIDGFAGPGEYTNGQLGSPVIALTAALQHAKEFPVPIQFLFIEEREDRFSQLESVLKRYQERIQHSSKIRLVSPRKGDCDTVLNEMLDRHKREGTHFGPALAFLDQFGYSAVPMQLIARILGFPQCEVFSYLDYRDMNRWITDSSKVPSFNRAFGGSEWMGAINRPESERRVFLLNTYKDALRERAKAKYVCSFSMFDKFGGPLYWLVFSTNHLRGLEEMKKVMWSVDATGGFQFSDEDCPGQLRLLDQKFDKTWLAEQLRTNLAGKTMTVAQIKEYVLVITPCYLFKEALRSLELGKDRVISVMKAPAKRKPGTYPEKELQNISLRFGKAALF